MKNSYFKAELYNPKSNKLILFAQLKANSTYEEFKKIINSNLTHPLTKKLFETNLLPDQYSQIRDNRMIYTTNDLSSELNWNIYQVIKHASVISKFNEFKKQYDKSLILEDFEKAENILNKIEKDICKSLWSIENRFILKELTEGSHSNWNFLSDLAKNSIDPLLSLFIELLSKKAESKISYFRYRNIFNNQLLNIEAPPEFNEYLCFKLAYPAYSGYSFYPYYLTIESISTLIDKYLFIKDILTEVIIDPVISKRSEAIPYINLLRTNIQNDKSIIQLYNLTAEKDYFVFTEDNKLFYNLLDKYTRGNFEFCIGETPKLINQYPTSIELYEIYIKSLIELKKKPETIIHKSKLITNILENLYCIFARESDNNKASEDLFKISLTYYSTNWAKQLLSIVSNQTNKKTENRFHNSKYIINSEFNNPRAISFAFNQSSYINEFNKIYADVISFKINKYAFEKNRIEFETLALKHNRSKLYLGRIIDEKSNLTQFKEHFENLINDESISITIYEEVLIKLFNIYIVEENFENAFLLYVDNYLKNIHLVTKLDDELLLSKLSKDDKSYSNLLELAIFYTIASQDLYQQYVAYDNFLLSKEVERPSDLFKNDIVIPKTKFNYFLRYVCSKDIIQHSISFDDSDELDTERLRILRELIILDPENENDYIKEITELSQNRLVRQAIREVNKGRITVNYQKLKNLESANIKENFNRYQELANYTKDKELVAVDASTQFLKEYLNNLHDDNLKKKIVSLGDPAFISFKMIFLEIRDKYIFSKEFGLDGYLSTRVRHGAFINHIRSVFESLNLVTQKDEKGLYLDNKYIDSHLPSPLKTFRSTIQTKVKEFSKEIDDYNEFIIKELFQVKTEKASSKQSGLFDYSFNQEKLVYIFSIVREKINNYDAFLKVIFDLLNDTTIHNLDQIRELLNNGIKENYDQIINKFNDEIRSIIGTCSFVELTSALIKCRTNLHNELQNTSEWFNLSNPNKDLIVDTKSVIKTAVEITNSIYPNYKIIPTYNINGDVHFVGQTCNHFIYINRILLDNIIKHSGLTSENLNVFINANYENPILICSYKNNLNENVNIKKLKTILENVKTDWLKTDKGLEKINIEGGSGFDKIKRILAFDLNCKKFGFNFSIDNNNVEIEISFELKTTEYEFNQDSTY